jgi:hypothetical protein
MIGFKELALLAVVVLVLYGRSGVLKNQKVQAVLPWLSPQRRTVRPRGSSQAATSSQPQSSGASAPTGRRGRARHFILKGNRLFWFLTILAATAVAAVIFSRMMIAGGTAPPLSR